MGKVLSVKQKSARKGKVRVKNAAKICSYFETFDDTQKDLLQIKRSFCGLFSGKQQISN